MFFIAKRSIKSNGKWIEPGEKFECTDQADIDRLVQYRAAVEYKEALAVPAVVQAAPVAPVVDNSNLSDAPTVPDVEDFQDDTDTEEADAPESIIVDTPVVVPVDDDSSETATFESVLGLASVATDVESVLIENGYTTVESLKSATLPELVALPKIGYARAKKIIAEVAGK